MTRSEDEVEEVDDKDADEDADADTDTDYRKKGKNISSDFDVLEEEDLKPQVNMKDPKNLYVFFELISVNVFIHTISAPRTGYTSYTESSLKPRSQTFIRGSQLSSASCLYFILFFALAHKHVVTLLISLGTTVTLPQVMSPPSTSAYKPGSWERPRATSGKFVFFVLKNLD